jgi:hypothetical protein
VPIDKAKEATAIIVVRFFMAISQLVSTRFVLFVRPCDTIVGVDRSAGTVYDLLLRRPGLEARLKHF